MADKEILIYTGLAAVSICGLYVLYHLLFRKGHHFKFNRFFILMALMFSFVFPLISFDLSQDTFDTINHFQPIYDFWEPVESGINNQMITSEGSSFHPIAWLFFLYILGATLCMLRYAIKLYSIIKIIVQHDKIKFDKYTLIKLKEGSPTFSFGSYILSDQLPNYKNKAMFDHELCHIDQWHTLDLLLVELLLTLQWFNPFIYLFKNKLVETHEYLADENVLKHNQNKIFYMKLLFIAAGNQFHHRFTSTFHSNILKRINMINRKNNITLKIWKPFIPLFFGIAAILLHSGFSGLKEIVTIDNLNNNSIINDEVNNSGINPLILEDKPVFQQPIKKDNLISIRSKYGMRVHPILKKKMMHNGIDYSADEGTKIYAPMEGKVLTAGYYGDFGNYIIINHSNGFSSRYAHMATIDVKEGDVVSLGQVIGTVGKTGMSMGPHLHFEILKNGNFVNPDDYLEPYK